MKPPRPSLSRTTASQPHRHLSRLLLLVSVLLVMARPYELVTATDVAACGCNSAENARLDRVDAQQHSRRFQFVYAGGAVDLTPGSEVSVWIPLPRCGEHQSVRVVAHTLPAVAVTGSDDRYGNCMASFKQRVPANGEISFSITYEFDRIEVKGLRGRRQQLSERERALLLAPNARVPVTGRPLTLLEGLTLPTQQTALSRLLYQRVDEHMKYDKSRPGYGQGDSNWACDSRFGNCTDFHSLFISLARSQGLPSRFEIGFPLPPERGAGEITGYHCWAFVNTTEDGWIPVDISEADKFPNLKNYYFGNLTENRVTFSTGRDIDLVPRQAGPALNYFIYPYFETDGKPLSDKQLVRKFSFRDLPSAQ